MLKNFKRLSIILALAVLLTLGAAIALLASLDASRIKHALQTQLQQHSGLELRLPGELDWQILPTLAVTVGQGELHSARPFAGDSLLASFDKIELGLNWRSLLNQRLEFTTLRFERLQLRLVTDVDGTQNWQVSGEPSADSSQLPADTANRDSGRSASALPPLQFNTLAIRDTKILLIDLASQSQQTMQLDELSATGLNAEGEPFPLSAALSVDGSPTLQLRADTSLDLARNRLTLDGLQIAANQSHASGRLALSYAPSLTMSADLHIDQLDLDAYQSASKPARGPASSEPAVAGDNDGGMGALPLEWLDLLQGSLSLRIDRLVANQVTFTTVTLQATLADSVLEIEKLTANAFAGSMHFSGTLDNRQHPARLALQQAFKAIQMQQLLASVDTPVALSGQAAMSSRLTASGNQWQQWMQTLSGQTSLVLQQAHFADDNLDRRACQAIALVRNERLGSDWADGTDLTEVSAAIRWQQGVANIEELVAATPTFRLAGEGQYRLPDNYYDLRIGAILSPANEEVLATMDPGCIVNERYRDVAWPLRCRGDLDKRDCGVDNSRLDKLIKQRLGDQARDELEEKVQREVHDKLKEKLGDELGEKLGDSVGDALQDALDGLFR